MISVEACNSLVDEVYSVCLELFGTVQVGQDEDLCSVLYRQICAQSVLAHHLQPLQSILPTTERQETAGKLNYLNSTAIDNYRCPA